MADPFVKDVVSNIGILIGCDQFYKFKPKFGMVESIHVIDTNVGAMINGPLPFTGRNNPVQTNMVTVLHINGFKSHNLVRNTRVFYKSK